MSALMTEFTNHGSQFSAVFKVKLNCAEPLCFGKHYLSPESPGNRPHPLTAMV